MPLGDRHEFEIVEAEKIIEARFVIGQIIPERRGNLIGCRRASPEQPGRFFHGFATRLEVVDRRAAEIQGAGRFRHRSDHVPNARVAIHDDFIIGMVTGVVFKFQEIGNIAKVHVNRGAQA